MESTLYIFGCGGHARSVADIHISNEPKSTIAFIDKGAKENEKIVGFIVNKEYIPSITDKLFLGIGDNHLRYEKGEELKNHIFVSIISSRAHIGTGAVINPGCFIGNYCHIGPDATIGKNSIINNGAIVEHEVIIGEYCHLAPNVTVSGRTTLGDLVFVGVGATIINNISICSNVIIGAGATVTKNITEPGTYVGTPAKKINH